MSRLAKLVLAIAGPDECRHADGRRLRADAQRILKTPGELPAACFSNDMLLTRCAIAAVIDFGRCG
jgi:hypothetical protein